MSSVLPGTSGKDFRVASSTFGCPLSVNSLGSHPYNSFSLLATCCRDPGLNTTVLYLVTSTPALYPSFLLSRFGVNTLSTCSHDPKMSTSLEWRSSLLADNTARSSVAFSSSKGHPFSSCRCRYRASSSSVSIASQGAPPDLRICLMSLAVTSVSCSQ